MNELYVKEFVKQAMQQRVPQTKIAALLQRASQIVNSQVKAASTKLDIVDGLIKESGLQKTASSVSYVHGILNEALVNGADVPEAIQFTKQALDATNKRINFMEKVSKIANDPKLNLYAEGFIEKAKIAGMEQDEAIQLLVDVVDREKRAAGDDEMFKHPTDGMEVPPAPEGDPSVGAPPGMNPGAGNSTDDAEVAQILQMLQSLPPEEQQQIIQQLLAAIGSAQGGPAGPGAGEGVAPGPLAPPAQAGPGGPMGPQGPIPA
jgi:hypothetical protein